MNAHHIYKIPLTLTRQPEGGYVVTSSALPELVTEGDTLAEALEHVPDALQAVVELYEDLHKTLPEQIFLPPHVETFSFDYAITVP